MAIFNKKDEITPTYIFFHFLRVSSRFFASGKVQTISSTLWSLRFILFLFSSTFFLPFGFSVPVLSSSFYFLPLLPTPIWFSGAGAVLPYYFLLFCFPFATLQVLFSSILFSFHRTTFYAMFFSLCLSMMCFYH